MQPTSSADIIAFYNQVGASGWVAGWLGGWLLLPPRSFPYHLPTLIGLQCRQSVVRMHCSH